MCGKTDWSLLTLGACARRLQYLVCVYVCVCVRVCVRRLLSSLLVFTVGLRCPWTAQKAFKQEFKGFQHGNFAENGSFVSYGMICLL